MLIRRVSGYERQERNKINMIEKLEKVDPITLQGTGEFYTREECHALGICHRGVFVIVKGSHGDILLQKRSASKKAFPGMWDLSCAGHVAAGESIYETASRELREELGIELGPNPDTASKAEFEEFWGKRHQFHVEEKFEPYEGCREHEICHVFLVEYNGKFNVDGNEVEMVAWATWGEAMEMARTGKMVAHSEILQTLDRTWYPRKTKYGRRIY